MCGRHTFFANYEDTVDRFHIEAGIAEAEYEKSYNIVPSQSVTPFMNGSEIATTKFRCGFI